MYAKGVPRNTCNAGRIVALRVRDSSPYVGKHLRIAVTIRIDKRTDADNSGVTSERADALRCNAYARRAFVCDVISGRSVVPSAGRQRGVMSILLGLDGTERA